MSWFIEFLEVEQNIRAGNRDTHSFIEFMYPLNRHTLKIVKNNYYHRSFQNTIVGSIHFKVGYDTTCCTGTGSLCRGEAEQRQGSRPQRGQHRDGPILQEDKEENRSQGLTGSVPVSEPPIKGHFPALL